MIENVNWSSCKVPVILALCNEICIFSTDFRKILKISIFMKFRPVGVEFHAERRTDGHDEAVSRFSQFCEDT